MSYGFADSLRAGSGRKEFHGFIISIYHDVRSPELQIHEIHIFCLRGSLITSGREQGTIKKDEIQTPVSQFSIT